MPRAPGAGIPSVIWWMMLATLVVTGLAYWDEERESRAALDDFAQEQARLAKGVSSALSARLSALLAETLALGGAQSATTERQASEFEMHVRPAKSPPFQAPEDGTTFRLSVPLNETARVDVVVKTALLLAGVRGVEEPGSIRVLVQRPSNLGLVTTNGAVVRSQVIESALDARALWVRLSREEAAALDLPARTAMAGLSTINAGPLGKWGFAVVASAQRERDRERRAQGRLVLGVVVASGLVLAFGGLALRKQRKELELAHDLAVAEIQRERDERLVRADKLATMGALATGIAHEVSTPLGVIMGRAEQLLPKVDSDERAKRLVEVISEQSERISRIIRGFLSLARGGSPTLEHTEPGALGRNAVELVEHRFTKAGVSLATAIASDLPLVACEPRLFEQVLVNLLLNACDACARGGSVELSIRADSERVAFVVTDDGTGITDEAAARAIEPFFTTKPEGEGTGLGLAIANEIVKHHCGELTIASRGSVGTRACVEIPAVHERTHA
jgi:two-component system NtrC family sensor kinase